MTEKDLSEHERGLWIKSQHAIELRNYGHATALIEALLKAQPGFVEGYNRLREIEIAAGTRKRLETVRAVFLDRDGVINRPVIRDGKPYPPASLVEFEFLPGVIEACVELRMADWLLVVATNQPDVGRGTQSREAVEEMHEVMCRILPIDRVEVCYDPGQGKPSEFRKPAPGMLLRAARELGIDLARSWMIGDRWRDIDCAAAAGCRTIFLDYGYDEKLRAQPDFRATSLLEAATIVLAQG